MEPIALTISLVVLAGMLCQWLAWRVRLPAILFLLMAGLLAGPTLGWLDPDAVFGELLIPVVSLSVAIILFEGSLTLNLSELRGVSTIVQRMVSVGALVTWLIVALATRWIFEFSWQVSALFGAVVIVTGPTVIVPMLRSVRPRARVGNILRWEGIAIDPVGALMAVMTYEFILASVEKVAISHVILLFMQTVGAGLCIGIVSGIVLARLIANNYIPEYLHNIATLSLVLVAFAVSNWLMHESGLIAVTVMGMWLANRPDLDIHPILNFKEHLSVLLISVLFIVLAARIDLLQLASIGWRAALLLLVLQFIARPLKILLSTWGAEISWQEKALLAWIAPRGIVAAAISAIFADKLVEVGYSDAVYLVPLTFSVIIGTVVLQSATARWLALWLGVAEPSPRGFLIVGANTFARKVAQELGKLGYRCVLADSNWDNIRQARMDGLDTFYGNPVSEHADLHLDLSGIGGLLALSHQRYINVIAAIHYSADFGESRIFRLASSSDKSRADKHSVSGSLQGSQLFGEQVSYSDILSWVSRGSEIKATKITGEYSWEQYCESFGIIEGQLPEDAMPQRLPLFCIDSKGLVKPFVAEKRLQPGPGSTILALSLGEAEKEPKKTPEAGAARAAQPLPSN